MTNLKENLICESFQNEVSKAIKDSELAANLEHNGLTGQVRELLVGKILRPALPPEVKIGTGKIVDAGGTLSKQVDVIIYAPHILPKFSFVDNDSVGIFPVESVLYTIEVKSKLNLKELNKAKDNAESVQILKHEDMIYYCPTCGVRRSDRGIDPINCLFAFGSDLKKQTEVERYVGIDSNARPFIDVICVVGKGYWHFKPEDGWHYYSADDNYSEVLILLAGMANTLPKLILDKGNPQFGNYLINDDGGVLV